MSGPDFGPTASLAVSVPAAETTPGHPCRIPVTVHNTGGAATSVSLAVVGIDPAWVLLPDILDGLGPGASAVFEVVVTVPLGHPAAELAASVVARDGAGYGRAVDLLLAVTDGSVVAASVDPPETRGGRRGRAEVVLRNRGRAPVRVDLEPVTPERDLRIRVKGATQVLAPGQQVRVPTRLNAPRPVTGAPRRRAYGIRVRTPGTPLHVEGAFTQRPLFPAFMSKGVAIGLVVALWAAVAIVGISSLSHHLNKSATQHAADNIPPASTAAGPTAGSGAGSGGGGGAGSSPSGSGPGTGGNGGGSSGGGSSGGGSGSGAAGGGAASAAGPSRISGKVSGPQPGGVTVMVTPTSLSSQAAQTATLTGSVTGGAPIQLASASFRLGKLYGPALPTSTPLRSAAPSVDSFSTTTNPDGSWAIASITSPGYYLVSFSKPGYATANYVVKVTGDGKPVVLQSRLVPGDGSLSGTVTGPSGPLGGARITITDGTVSLSTRTPTVGATGTWAVQGLTTPGTYLVTTALTGYSTETTLVTLAAGAHQSGINLSMAPGEGSVSGKVVSSSTSQPMGGLTVAVSNASVTRTTTTTTDGAVGSYSLPDLPVPGVYALSVSGPGVVTQTQQVSLQPGAENPTVNATVTPSAADVTGVATDSNGQGLAGAGAVLANQNNVFKTLTTSGGTAGSFDFGQVPPGQYVLSVEEFGYLTRSAQVTVGPGQVQTVNLSLPSVPLASIATATIQGSVQSLATSKPVTGAQIQLDGQPTTVSTDANGAYTISGVGPGTHTVTAQCPTATSCQSLDTTTNTLVAGGYESTNQQVTVPQGGVTFAQPILMPRLDQLAGVVIDGTGKVVPNPVVTLVNTKTGQQYAPNPNPTAAGATPANGGFEFDALPHGTYALTASTATPTSRGGSAGSTACTDTGLYKSYTNSITLAADTDYLLTGPPGSPNASPMLTIGPVYRVNTEIIPQGSTAPVPTSGVTVTVSGVAGTASAGFSVTCIETTAQPAIQLPNSGTNARFVASFSYTDSHSIGYSAPDSAPFGAVENSTSVDTAILVPPTPAVNISLVFPWRTPTAVLPDCPVATAAPVPGSGCPQLTEADLPSQVTLTGQVAVPGGGSEPRTFVAPPPTAGVWTLTASDLQGLIPGSVTLDVNGGAFQTYVLNTSTTTPGFGSQQLVLTPNTATVTGTLSTPAPGAAISVSPAVQGLSVTTSPTGQIVWQESGLGTGRAYPGDYDLTFAQHGYDTLVIKDFVVGMCDSTCPETVGVSGPPATVGSGTETYTPGADPVALTPNFGFDVAPSYTPQAGLPYPTVTVTQGAGHAPVGSVTLSSTTSDAVFSGLSVTGAPYTVTVAAPGYQTSTTHYADPFTGCTTSPTPCQALPSSGGTVTVAPTLGAEGYFTGTVEGLINSSPSPLPGATVTATAQADTSCSSASLPSTLKAITDSTGSFTITNPSASDGGVCVGATYVISVSAPGYTEVTPVPPVLVAAGDNNLTPSAAIDLTANRISQTFDIVDAITGNAVPNVTIDATSAVGQPVHDPGVTGTATVTVDPTQYTYTFSAAGYAPFSETITYYVNKPAPAVTVKLTFDTNTVEGYVTTPGTCTGAVAGGCPLAKATVTLINPASSSGPLATGTTDATGHYIFSPSSTPKVTIPDGTYLLQVSLAGYQYASGYQQSFATSPSLTTEKDVTLDPAPVSETISVTTNLSGLNLTGAIVSLAPPITPPAAPISCPSGSTLTATGGGSSQAASVSAGGTATLSALVPDFYDLTVGGPNIPAQQTDGLLVCPGGSVAEYSPAGSTAAPATTASFQVIAGRVSGSVTVPAGSRATDATVTLTPPTGTSGSAQQLVINCSTSDCSTGQFASSFEPLSSSGKYTLSVSAAGYQSVANQSFPLDITTPTYDAGTTTLSYTPVPVTITVQNLTSGQATTVVLEDTAGKQVLSGTVKSGQVSGSVAPDPTSSYVILVTTGSGSPTQEGTLYVPVGSSGVSATVSAPAPPPTTTTTTTTTTTKATTTTSTSSTTVAPTTTSHT